jgi:hypothetical protein
MKNALILHGTDFEETQNERNGNWFPWLKSELEKRGYSVWLPYLPQARQPNLERYWKFIKENGFDFNPETVLVGHSSGAAAILGILNKLPQGKKIDKAILVSGFYKNEKDFWNCQGLFEEKFDWGKMRKSVANGIVLIHSLDDPYVDPDHARYIQKKLDCKLIMKEKGGHFNLEYSLKYKQLPLMLELVERESLSK